MSREVLYSGDNPCGPSESKGVNQYFLSLLISSILTPFTHNPKGPLPMANSGNASRCLFLLTDSFYSSKSFCFLLLIVILSIGRPATDGAAKLNALIGILT